MQQKIKKIIDETKPDGITRKLKAIPEYWTVIDNWSNINGKGSEKIYLYYNQIQPPKCSCGSDKTPRFISLIKGYNEFCAGNCSAAIKAQTERRCKTLIENGGIGLSNPKSKEKAKQTNIEKYGVGNPGEIDSHKINMKNNNPMFLDVNKQKVKKTSFEKYGVDNPAQRNYSPETFKILNDPDMLKEKWEEHGTNLSNVLDINYTTLYRKLNKYNIRQPYESSPEKELSEYIESLGFNVVRNDRSIIKPQELDIVIPEKKIAIEYCGLYWHSELNEHIDRNYHKNKMIKANEAGYKLVTIFEDEWLERKEVVKSTIRHMLGHTTKKVYARKCHIRKISQALEDGFMDTHHIQGRSGSTKIRLGLYNDLDLVAVMSFRKRNNDEWELVRYCSKVQVLGGASKLFKHFLKKEKPLSVVSFSDNRWFSGGIYPLLGFTNEKALQSDYSYIKNQSRHHKFGFRKERLKAKFDIDITGKTEKELCDILGYIRIWDCGKIRWVWT